MSTIGSTGATPPGLNTTGFDPAGGQVSFDEARQQGLLRTDAGLAVEDAGPAALVDPGEAVLNLSAWEGAGGARTLPRSAEFAGQLAQLERGDAASAGVDGILAAL